MIQLQKQIKTYISTNVEYKSTAERCLQLIDKYSEDKTPFFRNCFDDGHFTSGVLVFNHDKTKVLLMKSKKFWTWQHFWGHADGDMDLRSVAIKEFEEESWLSQDNLTLENQLGYIDIHRIPEMHHPKHGFEPEHYHYDCNFVWIVDENIILSSSDDDVDEMSWFKIEELENESWKFSSGVLAMFEHQL